MPKKKQPAKYNHILPPEKMLKLRNDLPELMKKKVANIEFRHNLIQSQNRDNYINEYHRLHGYLTSKKIPTLADGQRIVNRIQELKQLTRDSYKPSVSPYLKTFLT